MADEKLNTGPGSEKLPEAPEPVAADQPPGGAGPVKTYRGGRHTLRGIFHYQL